MATSVTAKRKREESTGDGDNPDAKRRKAEEATRVAESVEAETFKARWDARKGEREATEARVKAVGFVAAAAAKPEKAAARVAFVPNAPVVVARAAEPARRGAMTLESASAGSDGTVVLEAIVGQGGFDDVRFFQNGATASRAVCRLAGNLLGTGFLIGPGIIMTNNHVIASKEIAREYTATFNYEVVGWEGAMNPDAKTFGLDPDKLFVTSGPTPKGGLDFTIVAVQDTSTDKRAKISDYGWLQVFNSEDSVLEGEPVLVIQHPSGRPKKVCLFKSELMDSNGPMLHYKTDTLKGSSGAPCFNRNWVLIALHHAARSEKEDGPIYANEGIKMGDIISCLKNKTNGVKGDTEKALKAIEKVAPTTDGPIAVTDSGVVIATEAAEAVHEHEQEFYDGRTGYDSAFLGKGKGLVVDIKLNKDKQKDAVPVAGGGVVLNYVHYSVVMSKSRKMPLYSACNIDGKVIAKINRKTGELTRPVVVEEAATRRELWWRDLRISSEHYLDNPKDVYGKATGLARGHMTRREDPVWGEDEEARLGEADTFHYTNCAPQHSSLNGGKWKSLEEAVLKGAIDGQIRVTVITGPIFRPDDPNHKGYQIPLEFFKIVAFKSGKKLKAYGFVHNQEDLIKDTLQPEGAEPEAMTLEAADITFTAKVKQHQKSIEYIESATGITFGTLRDVDEFDGMLEAARFRIDEAAPADTLPLDDVTVFHVFDRLSNADA